MEANSTSNTDCVIKKLYVDLRKDSPECGTNFINLPLLSLVYLSFSSLKITVWISALGNVGVE